MLRANYESHTNTRGRQASLSIVRLLHDQGSLKPVFLDEQLHARAVPIRCRLVLTLDSCGSRGYIGHATTSIAAGPSELGNLNSVRDSLDI